MTVTEGINIKFNLLGFVIPTERFKSIILTFLYNPTVPSLHFNETYAPVMRWESLRTILTLGAISKQSICQFDMKSAYLHGVIQEDIWIQQLEGFEVPEKEHLA